MNQTHGEKLNSIRKRRERNQYFLSTTQAKTIKFFIVLALPVHQTVFTFVKLLQSDNYKTTNQCLIEKLIKTNCNCAF